VCTVTAGVQGPTVKHGHLVEAPTSTTTVDVHAVKHARSGRSCLRYSSTVMIYCRHAFITITARRPLRALHFIHKQRRPDNEWLPARTTW